MKKSLSVMAGIMLLAPAAFAANALPTVSTFTVAASAVSPVPVSAFTATDSDGTVTGYMITESSTKPLATATGWSTSKPTSYTTTKTGSLTLYAWAKDNAAGVSAAKTATTNLLAKHSHYQADVVGLDASLAAKADVSALAAKADLSALDTKADISALAAKSDIAHNHDTLYQQKYGKVAVVAQSGGSYTDPVSAMNDLATWCGAPSAANPCLVKIMPGVYDIGSLKLSMMNNVDVEGSGENTTVIRGSGTTGNGSLVSGAVNSEIRNLEVQVTGGWRADVFSAIGFGDAGGAFSIKDVTVNSVSNISNRPGISVGGAGPDSIAALYISNVKIKGPSGYSYAINIGANADVKISNTEISGSMFIGILNYGQVTVKNTSVYSTTWGSYQGEPLNNHGTAALQGVTLTSSDYHAITNFGGSVTVDNSILKGVDAIYSDGSIMIANSRIDSPLGAISGTFKCINTIDTNYDRICP